MDLDIAGLAEAGLIASKLSRRDMLLDEDHSPFYFSPERCLHTLPCNINCPCFSRLLFNLNTTALLNSTICWLN